VCLCASLERAKNDFRALTGIEPTYGGAHGVTRSANYLADLGAERYLELFAPDDQRAPGSSPEMNAWLKLCPRYPTPTLITFCASSHDLVRLSRQLRALGVEASEPIAGNRRRPDGVLVSFEVVHCTDSRFGMAFPFFIDWKSTEHPSRTSAHGCTLESLQVLHALADEVCEIFAAIGLLVPVVPADAPSLDATLMTPRGRVRLEGAVVA
jgi:hypothetical protein